MAFERIARVIEDELGGPPASLFDTFEEIPFAAASLGQVHRATLGGRTLAVKVQYPDIERLIAADLKLVGRLGRFVMALSPVDGGSLVDELRERVKEECDYVAEAQNQRLFRGLLEDLGGQVPQVVEERSSRRVLTSTHSAGLPFQAFCDAASQPIKDRAGTNIFAAAFTCIFQHCVYNADPHPGNYLFTEQGQVVFLDFGCIKRFDAGFIDRWKRLALTVLDDDRPGFKDALDATGLVARPRRFDYDYHWQLMQYLYEPFLTAPFTFTHEYVRRSYDLMIFRNPNRFSTGMTRDWLFVNRLQWGLNSVLATLEATGPWNDLFRGVVESPTHSVV